MDAPTPPSSNGRSETLLDWLVRRYPTAKRQTLKRLAQAGRVRVAGRVVKKLVEVIPTGAEVLVAEKPGGTAPASAGRPDRLQARPDPRLRVVFEDADLLVVDKPPGLLTSTVPREPRPTLLALVRAHVEAQDPRAPVGLIHRLDRDASGLLVFSKGNDAYRSLKRQFFDHSVERVYTAVVEGVPHPLAGEIDTRLLERADGTVYSLPKGTHGKGERAVTRYETVGTNGSLSALRVTLLTGRKHQIRVHLSERGTPIVGDPLYGLKNAGPKKKKKTPPGDRPPPPRLMLAATKLSLTHPRTGGRLTFELPPPKAFARAFGTAIPIATSPVRR